MAANPLNVKRRMVSKSFHRILDTYSKQTFTGACARWAWAPLAVLVLPLLCFPGCGLKVARVQHSFCAPAAEAHRHGNVI